MPAVIDVLNMPVDTSLSAELLIMVGKSRALYPASSLNSGLSLVLEANMAVVNVEFISETVAVRLWHPVNLNSQKDSPLALIEARNNLLEQVLQLVLASEKGSAPRRINSPVLPQDVPTTVPNSPIVVGEVSGEATAQQSQTLTETDEDAQTCESCGRAIQSYTAGSHTVDSEEVVDFTTKRWGLALCVKCSNERNRTRISGGY